MRQALDFGEPDAIHNITDALQVSRTDGIDAQAARARAVGHVFFLDRPFLPIGKMAARPRMMMAL
jgi:hypothetical protein